QFFEVDDDSLFALDNDVAKLRDGIQARRRRERKLKILPQRNGRLPDAPGGDLAVLLAQLGNDFARRHAQRGSLLRIQPDAHAVVAWPKKRDIADTRYAGQHVLDVQRREIAKVKLVELVALGAGFLVFFLFGDQVDAQEDAGRFLLCGHPLALDFFGKLGFGDRDAVLHKNLSHVEIGAWLEGDVQDHLTVI